MDILEFALEKERVSREYYLDLAEKTSHSGLRKIFQMLADQESDHYDTIKHMKSHISPSLTETKVLEEARGIFQKIQESSNDFDFSTSELEAYEMARENETKSMNFYLDKAKEAEDNARKNLFLALADEEKKHYTVLDNICDFVSEPQRYLEDAEFVHIEGYPA